MMSSERVYQTPATPTEAADWREIEGLREENAGLRKRLVLFTNDRSRYRVVHWPDRDGWYVLDRENDAMLSIEGKWLAVFFEFHNTDLVTFPTFEEAFTSLKQWQKARER